MNESNEEIVRHALEAPDLEGFVAALGDDVVWDLTQAPGPESGVLHGLPELAGFLRRWIGAWEDYRCEVDETIESGDRVFVEYRQLGRARTTGIELKHTDFSVWTLRDGKAVRVEVHRDRDEAMRSAGLRS
jgi:ketosteroid isomerase-like protein